MGACLLWLVCAFHQPIIHQEREISKLQWEQITVRPGDTLWKYAGGHPELDRRWIVDEIQRRNDTGPMLSVGQVLWVPSKEGGR